MFLKKKYRVFIAYLCLKDMRYLVNLFEGRQDEIEDLWSQKSSTEKVLKRIRKPRYYEIPLNYLMALPVDVLREIDTFFDTVDRFLFYLEFTVDMPTTFSKNYGTQLIQIKDVFKPIEKKLADLCGE